MIKLQEIYNLCEGSEREDRKSAIKKLMNKDYSENNAIKCYNIWRRHYLESSSEDLMLSGIFIKIGKERKLLEECSFGERQNYLEALSREQLILVAQAVLK